MHGELETCGESLLFEFFLVQHSCSRPSSSQPLCSFLCVFTFYPPALELDSSNRKIPFHRPPLRAGKPQRESSKRSRLVRQATVHFGAEKLQASRQSLNASAFKAAIAEDANVQQTPCGSLAPTAADGSTMPDVREDEDHIVIEVEVSKHPKKYYDLG